MQSWFNKIQRFFRQVREEILKCTRPTAGELRESTLVVAVTMAILGVFIFASDYVISQVLGLILKIKI